MKSRVEQLRHIYVEEENKRKQERKKQKEERDYEIFSEMPYKLSRKSYSLGERHPVSKKRFDAA